LSKIGQITKLALVPLRSWPNNTNLRRGTRRGWSGEIPWDVRKGEGDGKGKGEGNGKGNGNGNGNYQY
jgi:hypothetical protein